MELIQAGKYLGSGIATVGLVGAGAGVGICFRSIDYVGSTKSDFKSGTFSLCYFSFALTEAIGLLALMMAFLIYLCNLFLHSGNEKNL